MKSHIFKDMHKKYYCKKAVIFSDSFDISWSPTREKPWILHSFSEPAFEFQETFSFPTQRKGNENCVRTERAVDKEDRENIEEKI